MQRGGIGIVRGPRVLSDSNNAILLVLRIVCDVCVEGDSIFSGLSRHGRCSDQQTAGVERFLPIDEDEDKGDKLLQKADKGEKPY